MKKNLLLAALGLAVSGAALADAKSFEGYNAGLNASSVKTDIEFTGGQTDGRGTVAGLQGGYTYALDKKWTLGLQAKANLGKTDASSADVGGVVQSKDTYSLSVEPGYAVSKSVLVYGIASYNQTKLSGEGLNTSFNGFGYGVGSRMKLNSNWYGQAELTSVSYDSENVLGDGGAPFGIKPKSTAISIGIGYKF